MLAGAWGNWFSGWLVDRLYRKRRWKASRLAPAMVGFTLAAAGLLASLDHVTGAVSATMNLTGNLGSFVAALVFPYLKTWFGSTTPLFVVGAVLNVLALLLWTRIQPEKRLEEY